MEDTALVKMAGITKTFGPVVALEDVDFHVDHQEIVGLVGDNGAGKSTLIKILAGVHRADKGHIYMDGSKVSFSSPMDARENGIETIYQDLALVEDLRIYRNIFLAREIVKSYLGIKLLDDKKMAQESVRALQGLSIAIPGSVRQPVRTLSGGQRQCVAVARSIYFDARVFAMDEPTAALGVAESREVLELIKDLKNRGKSCIVITHNLHHIFSVCDRITVLCKGKVVGDYTTKDTTMDEVEDAILGKGLMREF
jgi:simple sugar transport system ATP-binding protein